MLKVVRHNNIHVVYIRSQATDLAGSQPQFVLSWPRKMRLIWLPAEKNNRLSRLEKCSLITEKSIITVFNIYKLFDTPIFTMPCRRSYVFLCLCIKSTYFHSTAVITKRTHDLT